MKFYWIKTPALVAWLFGRFEWRVPTLEKKVYLTFDDGPIPEVTPFVLDTLKEFGAKASFFCIGDNVQKHPEIFELVKQSGNAIGNHTFHHVKGWGTDYNTYIEEVRMCEKLIGSAHPLDQKIMRPPYAKVTRRQAKTIKQMGYRIIMWDILSADFDQRISPEKCLDNVIKNIRPGSIIIFHDSQKAYENMKFALRGTLEYLKKEGYSCEPLY
ncbi:polysaccharide deacetylase family protein [Flavobacterium silvaticum]|uniref:Polysaccharide deacetylase family protein n=1 Tax=Flavobacterium silvaticum TaxID=1852020 RepID=A0A972JEN2_9FLAO|nr:polysaccharide deacetylase family protein [Flavobacterium silvaticum]NMH27074.1 polysaccharide deacetylase family protein [Flavobacterium silvaticum]